jgi:hypothetical protein
MRGQVASRVDVAQNTQIRDAAAVKVPQCVGQRMLSRPASVIKWLRWTPRPKRDQPEAAIFRRAKHRVVTSQRSKRIAKIHRIGSWNVAADDGDISAAEPPARRIHPLPDVTPALRDSHDPAG